MKARFLPIVLLMLPLAVYSYDAKINGIYYNFSGDEAVVTYQTYEVGTQDDGTQKVKYVSDCTGDVVIPASVTFEGKTYSVTAIGDYAFWHCTGVTSVTIPETVVSIGRDAFTNTSIITIDIPESVKYIGMQAFHSCQNLISVTVPKGVEKLEAAVFYYCSNLATVTLQEGLTYIGEWAFGECDGLTEITLPKSLTHIAGEAFYNCDLLESVNLPENLNTIGPFAFWHCISLTSIDIPENVVSLGGNCFAHCYNLSSVKLPNKLKRIEKFTFYDCANLTSITIPNSVTSIGEQAFVFCISLQSLSIPENVSFIELFAFGLCDLTSIKVEEGNPFYDSRDNCNAIIETASNSLILGCLTTEIPNSVKSIYVGAFYGLTDLTSVTVPEGVESLYDGAFQECSGLTSVTLPSSVKFIDDFVFYNCNNLKDFYCYAEDIPETRDSTFYDVPLESATLHVPAASLDKYKSTYPWSKFGNIVAQTATPLNTISKDASSNIPVCYDLNGRRIDSQLSPVNGHLRKGIFIQDGRKVLMK